jgi:hypothetical protein
MWGEQGPHGTHVWIPCMQAQRGLTHLVVARAQPHAKFPDGSRHKAGLANIAPCLLRLRAKLAEKTYGQLIITSVQAIMLLASLAHLTYTGNESILHA